MPFSWVPAASADAERWRNDGTTYATRRPCSSGPSGKVRTDRVCAVLAPATVEELEQQAGSPCARAMSEESLPPGGPVRRTDVYGNQARAVLSSDTLFLSHFASGWKVVAAGCEPRPQEPYRCRIKGG